MHVVVRSGPWSEIGVYAPDAKDDELKLTDSFVLCSHAPDENAPSEANAWFWHEALASEAKRVHDGLAPWRLYFEPTINSGGRRDEKQPKNRSFALWHRPGGSEAGQRVLFEGKSDAEVFCLGRGKKKEAEAAPKKKAAPANYLALFVATQFWASDKVASRQHEAKELELEKHVQLYEPDRLRDEAYEDNRLDDPLRGEPLTNGFFAEADRERAWPLGTLPPEDAHLPPLPTDSESAQISKRAKNLAEVFAPLEQAETWLYLYLTDEALTYTAGTMPTLPKCVGVWKVDADGQYQYAVYPEGSSLEAVYDPELAALEEHGEALPELVGAPSPYVLVDRDWPRDAMNSVFAHTSPVPLPLARCRHLGGQLWGGPNTKLASIDVEPRYAKTGRWFHALGRHTVYDKGARSFKCYLPDPYRIALRLAYIGLAALDELDRFERATNSVRDHAALLAGVCFDAEAERTYAASELVKGFYTKSLRAIPSPPPIHHSAISQSGPQTPLGYMETSEQQTAWLWKGFDPKAVSEVFFGTDSEAAYGRLGTSVSPHKKSQLALFSYGARCQRLYLRARARTAGHRLEVWWASTPFKWLRQDLTVGCLTSEADEESLLGRLATGLFDIALAMLDTGAGTTVLVDELKQSGLYEGLESDAPEEVEKTVGALSRYVSWAEVVKEPAVKLGWVLIRRIGAKIVGKHFELTSSVALVYSASQSKTSTKAGAVLQAGILSAHLEAAAEWTESRSPSSSVPGVEVRGLADVEGEAWTGRTVVHSNQYVEVVSYDPHRRKE